jgi:hypothetical protein
MPSLLALKVDMYPFPHFWQKNLNWKPRFEDRSS